MGKHSVPRRHLRHFESPERPEFIWQHDKRGNPPVLAKIGKVAQQEGYFDDDTEERLTREIERPGGDAIQKILERQPLTDSELRAFAVHVGSMIRRIPFHREWGRGIAADYLPGAIEEERRNFPVLLREVAEQHGHDEDWVQARIAVMERVLKEHQGELPQNIVDMVDSPFPSENVVAVLLTMHWRVLQSTGPQHFVTSDYPANFFLKEGIGLAVKDTELIFPISKEVALHGSHQPVVRPFFRDPANQRFVREVNKRMIMQATRFVFSHDNASWIAKLLTRTDLVITRLGR
ncbi:DUF4238 domain-containing protein [Tundrisphaera sp. TA3]|uniref:DUF4238 domain-containing protein n=1 Tax=Tundrisphaera sp. TA3 TaxID=3435775 RepID=UPI003EB868CB